MKFQIILMVTACLVTACAPIIPNYDYFSPRIEGRVIKNGTPLKNAEIRMSYLQSTVQRVATTDQNGQFEVEAFKKLRWMQPLISSLGNKDNNYVVYVIDGNTSYYGYYEDVMQLPKFVNLDCKIDDQSKAITELSSKESQLFYPICKAIKREYR